MTHFKNAQIYTGFHFVRGGFAVDKGRFLDVGPESAGAVDLNGALVLPGLVDIHTHGNSGCDFSDGSYEGLKTMAAFYARHGITSFAPASMTLPEDVLAKAYETAVRLHREQPEGCAVLRGIQMEGPFFAESKKGAQNAGYLRAPDAAMFHRLQETARGLIRIADVAPEEPGGLDYVREVSQSCRVSLAHTAADYDTAKAAFEAGATHVTHLFNAMPPLLHRTPGVIGAACENEQVTAELIGDGLHVHPSVVRLAYRAFGSARLCLISDSLSCCGCENGVYWLGGQQVFLDGAIARLADGTIAGSANHLFGILKQTVSMGIPLEDAVRMATYNPAQVLGVEQEVGQIAPGLRADFLVCTPDLQLRQVWLGGKELTD